MRRKIIVMMALAVVLITVGADAAMKADVKDSVQREYYDNGRLRLETVFKNGELVRKRAFYRNGQLKLEERVKNGEPVKVASYYENGHLQSLWTKKSGVTKYYHPTGKLRMVVDTRPENLNPGLRSSYIFSQ